MLASLTHVDNLVAALRQCLDLQRPIEGRCYNISDGEPVDLWELISQVARLLQLPPPRRRLPYPAAYLAAACLEWLYSLWNQEPPLTRYTLGLLAKSQTLDIGNARRDLDYLPLFDTHEGVRRTLLETPHRG